MGEEREFKVPSFVLVGGRTRAGIDLPLETLVRTTSLGRSAGPRLALERGRIAEMAADPLSIAEISAHLSVPLGVARVLVGDMVEEGLLDSQQLETGETGRPDTGLLERVLEGLESL